MLWQLHDIGAFPDLREGWDAVNQANRDLPILDARFFERLLALNPVTDGRLATCSLENRTVACAILVRTALGGWTTYQPSQAPLGAWVQEPSAPLPLLLESLRSALPAPAFLLSASQLDPSMVDRPTDDGCFSTIDHMETARLDLEGTFEDYWQSRGKNLKKNMTRQRNRLSREGIDATFVELSSPGEVGSAVDEYGRLESRGWKASEGTALHPDNEQGTFYRALMEEYSERGESLVWRYLYDGVLVASELYLARGGTILLLKTTHDEDQRATSPTYLLREASMRSLFEGERCERIEFYGRVVDWHRRWTDDFRGLYHANQFSSSWVAGAAAAKRRLVSSREG